MFCSISVVGSVPLAWPDSYGSFTTMKCDKRNMRIKKCAPRSSLGSSPGSSPAASPGAPGLARASPGQKVVTSRALSQDTVGKR